MRSLFLKIFLSYWLAQALFVVLAILLTLASRPPQDSPRGEYLHQAVASYLVQTYEHGGAPALRKSVAALRGSLHEHNAFILDDQGNDLSGVQAPEWARQLARGITKSGALRLQSDRRSAQAVTGSDGRRYILVIEHPPISPRFFVSPGHMPGPGILIAILTSGLVCFLLARSLTAPIIRLRTATHQLANGELSARAGPAGAGRRDEIAELVRDFDAMAERLENLVNAQARLLNDISHELRSPLARLSVALGLARQRTGPETVGNLDRIELEANRLNELIGRLLVLARMEGGDQDTEMAPVHMGELVGDVSRDAAFEAQGRNCRVRCNIRQDSMVFGNAALLHSAVENVVRNAMRYTQEGTEVQIDLESGEAAKRRQAIVRISDHGPGVPEQSLSKLFRPFYRLDDARNRQTGGVGLGLSITERAVRLHGGSVKAENRAGGGLVVEICLPAMSPITQNRPEPAATPIVRS
ncbi:MAG: HAMP domain-containing protein [Acidobacteria bacterium]|nr:HAMP domain-containing protein [Acidobacteriota bacterium]MBV8893359.1 HAMP domain-containing protein [Acidobacteriota bacterium]